MSVVRVSIHDASVVVIQHCSSIACTFRALQFAQVRPLWVRGALSDRVLGAAAEVDEMLSRLLDALVNGWSIRVRV